MSGATRKTSSQSASSPLRELAVDESQEPQDDSRALVSSPGGAAGVGVGVGAGGMTMIVPLADPQSARQAIEVFEALKSAIALKGDFVRDRQGRTYYKRKFWRRVALAFGLSLSLVSEERSVIGGVVRYSVVYRATAPNGQSMDGDGYCDSAEFGPTEHNTRAKAHTRAKNRAIADLVGGGEVSADEMPVPTSARRRPPAAASQRSTANGAAAASKPPSWSSLRLRGLQLHYETQAEWEEFVIAVTGKSDPRAYNDADRAAVAAALEAQTQAEATGSDPSSDLDDEWVVDEVPGEVLEEEGASPGDSDELEEPIEQQDLSQLGRGKAARH